MQSVNPIVIQRRCEIVSTSRVQQMQGMFDVPPALASEQTWHVHLPLPPEWSVGVIVGPSGSGKTTIARELFGQNLVGSWPWPADKSILDGFPAKMPIKDIIGLLSSVGFSSPPAWLRPFAVLSNGQQFRVNLARTLAEMPELAVVDEFTSVVDRTVAQIGSAAVAKTVRRRKQKFIAVACHYDILDWLEPDWIYEPETDIYTVADAARRVVRRPSIELDIAPVDQSAWKLFKSHHYLDANLARSARCYAGFVDDRPACFTAVLPFPHPRRPGWREHRTVCLPDFQGVGMGNAMSEFIASLYLATGKPFYSSTSHPSMIRHRMKSPLWRVTRKMGFVPKNGESSGIRATSTTRLTAGFEFIGPPRAAEAISMGVVRSPETKSGCSSDVAHKMPPLSSDVRQAIRRTLAQIR